MSYEWHIAHRMHLGDSTHRESSTSLRVALVGIVLAIVIMVLSIAIILGFKNEITQKIYNLDAHLKITNAALGLDENYTTMNGREVFSSIMSKSTFLDKVQSMSLIAEKSAILKTDNDFLGIQFRGVDDGYDFDYLKEHLVAGRCPRIVNADIQNEIIISNHVANQLNISLNDKILAFFIDDQVKARNMVIVGIFETDLEAFDHNFVIGSIGLIQQINRWNADIGNYVAINLKQTDNIAQEAYNCYAMLAQDTYDKERSTLYNVSTTQQNNASFFAWLDMLDMNVVVILVLMMIVSGFTLVSAMLMIVLERVQFIGILKVLGATNKSIRHIFIALTGKLIVASLVIGNLIGIGLALIQKYAHIVRLDSSTYYMPYVPIKIDIPALILLNLGILIISYATLIGPSYIISNIKPSATIRFD